MNLQEIYDFIGFIINKEQSGKYISPNEFTSLLRAANYRFFKKYFDVPEEYQVGMPISRIQWELTDTVKRKLSRFMESNDEANGNALAVTNGFATLPTDMFFHDYFASSKGLGRILKGYQFNSIKNNPVTFPTEDRPIATVRNNTTIEIAPNTLTKVDFYYLRRPKDPKYDFYVSAQGKTVYLAPGETSPSTGVPANKASESVELDWDQDCIWDIIALILEDVGMSITRGEVVQYANQKQATGV